MNISDKPIPAFYCCYLLRSKHRKSFYIGSTPNPARRLAQHNGNSKGGAKRTSMQGKRPWEMTCIVTGFPSKFAALQFEWAWQNTHATRHIERDVRDARVEDLQKKKTSKESKDVKKRNTRPPMSLEARLKNLCYLCGVKSFRRWPLQIRFFAKDVFEAWGKHTSKMTPGLRNDIPVRLTSAEFLSSATAGSLEDPAHEIPAVIREIPVAYEDTKPYVEKAKSLLETGRKSFCGVCQNSLGNQSSLVLVCPNKSCQTMSHVSCLSSRFLKEEGDIESLVPVEGTCPGCHSPTQWITLMKELSLRLRGQKEIEAMFKPKRRRKANSVSEPESTEGQILADEDEELDDTWMQDVEEAEDDEFPDIDTLIDTKK